MWGHVCACVVLLQAQCVSRQPLAAHPTHSRLKRAPAEPQASRTGGLRVSDSYDCPFAATALVVAEHHSRETRQPSVAVWRASAAAHLPTTSRSDRSVRQGATSGREGRL
jgi:hypothetical protein